MLWLGAALMVVGVGLALDREATVRVLVRGSIAAVLFLGLVALGAVVAVSSGNGRAVAMVEEMQSAWLPSLVRAGQAVDVDVEAMTAVQAAAVVEVLEAVPPEAWKTPAGRREIQRSLDLDLDLVSRGSVRSTSRLGGLSPEDLEALAEVADGRSGDTPQLLVDPDTLGRLLDAAERSSPGVTLRLSAATSELPAQTNALLLPGETVVPRSTVAAAAGSLSMDGYADAVRADLSGMGGGISMDIRPSVPSTTQPRSDAIDEDRNPVWTTSKTTRTAAGSDPWGAPSEAASGPSAGSPEPVEGAGLALDGVPVAGVPTSGEHDAAESKMAIREPAVLSATDELASDDSPSRRRVEGDEAVPNRPSGLLTPVWFPDDEAGD